jgi:hypothetical protein
VEAFVTGDAPVTAGNMETTYGIGLDKASNTLKLRSDMWTYDSASGKATYKGDADSDGVPDHSLTVQIDTSAVTLQSSEPGVDELVFILNSTGA